MTQLPDLSRLSHDEKDALILALWAQVQALTTQVQILTARVAELEAKLGVPPKTPDNSSVPPSKGHKPNRAKKAKRSGPRQGSLGRTGGGRALAANPDEVVTAKPVRCAHCQAALGATDQTLHGRYDKIDLPKVAPVVTRVEHYAGQCPSCGGITLAPLPEGLEPGTPFSLNIVALAMYLRFVHAVTLPATEPFADRAVWPRHQRGRARCRLSSGQAGVRCRCGQYPGPVASRARHLLG